MKKQAIALCIAILLLTGCAARLDEEKSTASIPKSAGTAVAGAVNTPSFDEIADLVEQAETVAPTEDEKLEQWAEAETATERALEQQAQNTAEQQTQVSEPQPARENNPPAQVTSKPSEVAPIQLETPESVPKDSPAPVQPEPEPVPDPQPPAQPAFDAGTVISMACSQIGGMTRVNGAEQGMGSFTHSFSVYETQEAIASGLASVMAQERDLYDNTWYDIVYCGESGGYHTFRCYRA